MKKGSTTQEKFLCYIETPIGDVCVADDGEGISDLYFVREEKEIDAKAKETPLLKKASLQLDEYFSGKRHDFDLPLSLHGTDFQMAVWEALLTIPYSETRSYKEIAEQIGRPKAYRAVGMANNRNPVSIIVPCHRVIGSDGSLVGYGGGLPLKDFLLRNERRLQAIRNMNLHADELMRAEHHGHHKVEDIEKETW